MKFLLIALAGLVLVPAANANDSEKMVVKSVSCASGKLREENTLSVGQTFSVADFRPANKGGCEYQCAFVETAKEAVSTFLIDGRNDGACENNDVPTILTVTFQK